MGISTLNMSEEGISEREDMSVGASKIEKQRRKKTKTKYPRTTDNFKRYNVVRLSVTTSLNSIA